ncbi:uncharacterized protein [Euwallacea similis]|uniref:uncharacterized protein n=1 Tax=Euwallacea similis TaxID=1736056 RepID=UPI00344EB7F7
MLLANLPLLVESDVNLIWDKQEKYAKIFKKHLKSSRLEQHYFKLTSNDGFNLFRNDVLLRSRRRLDVTLNACIVITNNDTLNHLTDKRDKHIDSITKANYPVVLSLASIYNITLNWTVVSTWGYKDNHSDWSGMMGQLTKKEADIGGTALFFTKDRIDLIDYIAMISPTRSKFIFRQPKLSYVSNVYTLPLDIKVWFSTALLMLIIALILFLAMKWEYMKNQLDHSNQTELSGSLRDVIFITLGALCQQSAAALPYSTPGRIVTLCLFISLMFMYVSYSAIIVALLQTSSNSINTLEDLLNSRIEVGVDDTVFNHFYFTTASEHIRKAIYEKKVSPPGKPANFFPVEKGIQRMRQGLFAFHVETGVGYKLVGETFKEDEKCGLQEIQYLQVIDPWLAIQKNSSYKEHLKVGLRILQENGVQQRETGLIYTKKPSCHSKGSNFVSVGIVDCYAPAVILTAGLAASVVLFILEIYVHRIVSVHTAITKSITTLNRVLMDNLLIGLNTSVQSLKLGKSKQMEKFDLLGTPLTTSLDKELGGYLSFLGHVACVERKLIFRAAPHSYISNLFTLPFDSFVWYSCFGLLAVIFISMYLVVYWEWSESAFKPSLNPRFNLRPYLVDILLMEVGSLSQEGSETQPESHSGRIIFICTLVSLMFLCTSFSANIVALLQSTSERLNSLETLQRSRILILSNLTEGDSHFSSDSSLEYEVKRMQNEFIALNASTYEVYYYVNKLFFENEKCALREVPVRGSNVDFWSFVHRESSLKDLMKARMMNLEEKGIKSRELQRLLPGKPQCDGSAGSFTSVGLIDSYGAFFVVLSGYLMSSLVCLSELLWTNYLRKTN